MNLFFIDFKRDEHPNSYSLGILFTGNLIRNEVMEFFIYEIFRQIFEMHFLDFNKSYVEIIESNNYNGLFKFHLKYQNKIIGDFYFEEYPEKLKLIFKLI